jgi:hypothetical protein
MDLNKYYSKTLCIRFFTNLSLRIAPILLIFVGGCASNHQYCGVDIPVAVVEQPPLECLDTSITNQ